MKRNKIKKIIFLFLLLIFSYYGMLVFAYMIPDNLIIEKWTESVNIIASEGKRWMVIPGNEATKLDTFTDNLIFQKMTNVEYFNPLKSSLWLDGYYRYWMGVHAVLRPALLFINYSGMRYFNMIFLVFLFSLTIIQLNKALGLKVTGIFIFSLSLIHFWIFPLSIQYSAVFIVLLFSVNLLLYTNKQNSNLFNNICIFVMIGSLTNYFDLLTVPLLTFGIPYVILFFMNNSKEVVPFIKNIKELIVIGLSWLVGYGMTWTAKWLIGSVILKENMLKAAVNQILFRTSGDGDPIRRMDILTNVTDLMFPSYLIKILIIIFLIWFILFILFKKRLTNIVNYIPLLIVGVIPYLWFIVLANHNQHHAYFTYRNQAITVFSVMAFMLLSIDWDALRHILKKINRNFHKILKNLK